MNPEENEDMHQIDDLEHKLYDPKQVNGEDSLHHVHNHKEVDLPTDWGENTPIITPVEEKETSFSFGTKVLFTALIFLFVVLSFTAWRVLSSRNVVSLDNIDITLDSKPYVDGGETTPFSVSVFNRNTSSLQEAVIIISYEKGIGVLDEQQKVYEKRVLGTILPNSLKKEDLNITLYGAADEVRVISVKLEYKVAGANAVFNKPATTQVVLKTPPLSVHIDGQTSLVQGQNSTFNVFVSNNTSIEIKDSLVVLSIPTTFTLNKTEPKPNTKGMMWSIPSILPGATSTITISGSFAGMPGEVDTIKASVGAASTAVNQMGVVYSQEAHSISITSPLLSLGSRLETDRGGAESLRYGDKAIVTIFYENKNDKALRDVLVVANIGGTAPIISGISSDGGYYDSINKTVTFNPVTNRELSSVAPGAKGEFKIYIPVVSKGNNSPKLTLVINGTATSVSKDDTATQISKVWNVEGSANLNAFTSYKNSTFTNTGPIPPKANVNTTYGAHLIVSAQNSLVNSRVSFILPAYVTFTGVYATGTNVTYDNRTRTVVWDIGNISAGGVVSNDIQISVKPSQSHVGQTPPITSSVTLEADEADSKARIRNISNALTTELLREQGSVDISHVVAN
ncbi:TPA: hypothetical protein DEP94_02610 [Candidatus Nomurabacteria bacterium]|nr:hypothetical protein [Candidatus Nomurabacteria bacterium]